MRQVLLLALLFISYTNVAMAASRGNCASHAGATQSPEFSILGSDADVRQFFRILGSKYRSYGMYLPRTTSLEFETTERDQKFEVGLQLQVVNHKPIDIGIPMALGDFDLDLRFRNRYGDEVPPVRLLRIEKSVETIYQGTIDLDGGSIRVKAVPYKEMVLGGNNGYDSTGKPFYNHSVHRGFRLSFGLPKSLK